MWEGPWCPDSVRSDAHSANLRLYRLGDGPATFFITKSLHPKKPVLNKQLREIILSALAFAVEQNRIYLRAFVVMPDHWHALFALREPWTLPKFMHALMSYVAGKSSTLLSTHKTSWQDGYYEHSREDSKTVRVCDFLHRAESRNEGTGRGTRRLGCKQRSKERLSNGALAVVP